MSTYGSALSPNDLNGNFKCEATGDFRKAMCEYTWVVQSDEACNTAYNPNAPQVGPFPPPVGVSAPTGINAAIAARGGPADFYDTFPQNNRQTAIVKCQFMLDQLDADTGKVDELMCDIECCGFDGCSDYPWFFVSLLFNQAADQDPNINAIPPTELESTFGPQLLVNLSMEAGKSNNHVKAIKVKQRPMVTENGRNFIPSSLNPFNAIHYLRKTAGGFKEL